MPRRPAIMPLAPKRKILFPSNSINAFPFPKRKVSRKRPAVTMALRTVTPIKGSTFAKPVFSRIGVAPHNKVVTINKKITSFLPPRSRPTSKCLNLFDDRVRKFHFSPPYPDVQFVFFDSMIIRPPCRQKMVSVGKGFVLRDFR